MKYNFYDTIIEICNYYNMDVNLKFIGKVNDKINRLIERGISEIWIKLNMELLVLEC